MRMCLHALILVGWLAPRPGRVATRIPKHHATHVRVRFLQLLHDAQGLCTIRIGPSATAVGDTHPKHDF